MRSKFGVPVTYCVAMIALDYVGDLDALIILSVVRSILVIVVLCHRFLDRTCVFY